MPWIWLVVAALTTMGLASIATPAEARKPKTFRPNYWPQSWPSPPGEFLTAVASAAEKYKVATADLIALGFVESRFDPYPRHRQLPKTWAKIRDKQIGKSGKTWSQVYQEKDCHAYGIMGLLPFNFVGVPGGLTVGAPLSRGANITLNVHMAARFLRANYDKTGDWISAYHAYNPGGGDDYYQRFRKAKAEFERARAQA